MPANGGGLAAGTPYIDPAKQACIVCEDMPCAKACETGALTAEPWTTVKMGVLELDPERCITFQGATCGVCARGPWQLGVRPENLDSRVTYTAQPPVPREERPQQDQQPFGFPPPGAFQNIPDAIQQAIASGLQNAGQGGGPQ